MLVRRAFFHWLFPAAVALPGWLLIGWAIFGQGGWSTLGLLITIPATFLSLVVIGLLVRARPTVRAERAVSWVDVGVIGGWHVALIAAGCYGDTAFFFGVLSLLAAVAAFWVSIWQLVADGARRMQAQMAEYERMARPPQPDSGRTPPDDGDGDVFVVREVRD